MTTNFQFLKKINNNLYEIIYEAEKLYRDEYFEQCMVQTRRFGEQICKEMFIEENREPSSFDEMLATLKDQSHGYTQEKEFIDDLYFLKKNGNKSVHSGTVKKDAIIALECLQRSFEVAINYSVYNKGASSDILKLNYDIELLVTNKKTTPSLKERYEKAKLEEKKEKQNTSTNNINYEKKRTTKPIKSSNKPQVSLKKTIKVEIPLFWKTIIFLISISISIILFLTIAILIK